MGARPGHDAAHILVGEEIVPGELQVVYGTLSVEEKWIGAAPCPTLPWGGKVVGLWHRTLVRADPRTGVGSRR
ncbi:MAG: hypothetical protein QOH35_1362, partial [Acidobacteriaceae bacterium]|nr:hypothetical protein [Acidobacteriaceae bacterium]